MDKELDVALAHCLSVNCSYTVDSASGGRFALWLAEDIARKDSSVVRDSARKIIKDYRKEVNK